MMQPTNDHEIPADFLCPITHELMSDPVLASDGETYEREAIEAHFKQSLQRVGKNISPLHRIEMDDRLVPNRRMVSMITEFLTKHPQFKDQTYFPDTLVTNCLKAIQTKTVNALQALLDKEQRLLKKPLINNKSVLAHVCEQGTEEQLLLVINRLQRLNKFHFSAEELTQLFLACCQNLILRHAGVKAFILALQWTPVQITSYLKEALTTGQLAIVQSLIMARLIELDVTLDEQGNKALHLAARHQQSAIAHWLIEQGANSKLLNQAGERAEHVAAQHGHRILAQDIPRWRQEKKLGPILNKFKDDITELKQENERLKQQEKSFREELFSFFKKNLQLTGFKSKRILADSAPAPTPKLHTRRIASFMEEPPTTRTKPFSEHSSNRINCLQTLPNGHLASASAYGDIKIWDLATGQCLQTLKGEANHMQVLPKGYLVTSAYDDDTKVWNPTNGQCLLNMKEKHTCLQALPNGHLVTGSDDIKIWNLATGQCLQTLKGRANLMQLLPNGHLITRFYDDIKVWNLATGECLQTLSLNDRRSHSAFVVSSVKRTDCMQVLPDGRIILNSEETIKIFELATGQCLQTPMKGKAFYLQLLPDGRLIGIFEYAGRDTNIEIWHLGTGQRLQTLYGYENKSTTCLQVLPDGCFVSGYSDGTIQLWEASTLKLEVEFDKKEIEKRQTGAPECSIS